MGERDANSDFAGVILDIKVMNPSPLQWQKVKELITCNSESSLTWQWHKDTSP